MVVNTDASVIWVSVKVKLEEKMVLRSSVIVILLALAVGANDLWAESKMGIAELINAQGKKVGKATFVEGKDGVEIAIEVYGIPQGLHGFHIHSVGKCETPDFKTAGGHFNPYARKHGLKNPDGSHSGDMPNLLIGPSGNSSAIVLVPLVTLGEGKNSLFQSEGTSIVIHAGEDDQMTDPSGNSGDRIACGIIKKGE